ncbi:hypothetical protein [Halobacterium litoreum]|uniref:Uncharacterized protein n=1 Tax=Halobacterium litoreum TaxID=2039234 RepID=A0ABD5N868_9EURY|nr:hypothetical protein [Halobacterium litoreum]UHH14871.1 hypothetical protein LT972_14790 [Halobacterium litoreum]
MPLPGSSYGGFDDSTPDAEPDAPEWSPGGTPDADPPEPDPVNDGNPSYSDWNTGLTENGVDDSGSPNDDPVQSDNDNDDLVVPTGANNPTNYDVDDGNVGDTTLGGNDSSQATNPDVHDAVGSTGGTPDEDPGYVPDPTTEGADTVLVNTDVSDPASIVRDLPDRFNEVLNETYSGDGGVEETVSGALDGVSRVVVAVVLAVVALVVLAFGGGE